MPFTLYHFGPSGFVGLTFRKYIDVPVFVLANVAVDLEVLFADKWPQHRYWHWHSLLIGSAVGIGLALTAYPVRHLFKRIMQTIRIPYRTGFWKMVLSGILGAWLHVLIDAVYHYDVQPFWPNPSNPLWKLLSPGQVKIICVAFFIAAAIPYVVAVHSYLKQNRTEKADRETN